jgi:hypothetical protein
MTQEEFKYARVREIQEDSPFYVSKLTRAILRHTNDGPELHVTLDRKEFLKAGPLDENNRSQDPWIKALTAGNNPGEEVMREALKQFSKGKDVPIATERHPVRWLGAGGILVIKDRSDLYVLLNKREGSAVWKDRFDANGGFSSSIEEMLSPISLAQRELGEELFIGSKPISDSKLQRIIPKRSWKVSMSFKRNFCEDGLIFTPDPSTGTLDFRIIEALKTKYIDSLTFGDRETIHAKDNSQIRTNRPTFVFRLVDILGIFSSPNMIVRPLKGFRNGIKMADEELLRYEISDSSITPTLKDLLLALKNDVDFSQLD